MPLDVHRYSEQVILDPARMSMPESANSILEATSGPTCEQARAIHKQEPSGDGELSTRSDNGHSPNAGVSIVIADSVAITSELLTAALSKRKEFAILGCAKSIEELIGMLSEHGPDILLIRGSNQGSMFTPLAVLVATSRVSPGTRSIVLSGDLERDDIVSYFQAQARGILPADITDFETLCKCIYSVNQGQIWASSKQLNYLIDSLSGPKPVQIVNANGDMVLSAREQEVLNLLAEGRSNRAMAEALNLSEHTIKNHLFHIFYKLGVSNRTEAILCAMRQRTVPQSRNAS